MVGHFALAYISSMITSEEMVLFAWMMAISHDENLKAVCNYE